MVHASPRQPGGSRAQTIAMVIIRLCTGAFVFFFGLEKASWMLDSTPLATQVSAWMIDAAAVSRWYLERLAPGVPVIARVVPIGSMVGGLALAVGFWTRIAAGLSLVMVLSLQLAAGSMFRSAYLSDASGLPLVGALLGLLIGGARLPFSVRN